MAVLEQEFDSGTVRRRSRESSAAVIGQSVPQDDRQATVDSDDVDSKDVMMVGLDQEFDSGTVKRRQKPAGAAADDSSHQPTDSLTVDVVTVQHS